MFEGLYISKTDYNWEEYPIIHIDFGRSDSTSKTNLELWINRELKEIAEKNSVSLKGNSPALLFGELIKGLNSKYGKVVVILIDEYDRPITNNVEDDKKINEIRIMMEAFYQMIKGYESMERFVFLTGITRLSQISIFSKLNNLDDISRKTDYAGQSVQEMNGISVMIQQAAIKGNCDKMISLIKSLLETVPYDIQIKYEKYYQSLMYLVFKMCGMDIIAEETTNIGRIDATMKAGDYIYIIECKIKKDSNEAIAQIDDKKYYEKYLAEKENGRKIYGIGIDFYDDNVRNIQDYQVKE